MSCLNYSNVEIRNGVNIGNIVNIDNNTNDDNFVGANNDVSNKHKDVSSPNGVSNGGRYSTAEEITSLQPALFIEAETVRNNRKNSTVVREGGIINYTIFRYKFSDDFIGELFKFSKIHQYDHRADFKEAWKIWLDDNQDMVTTESRRMTNSGYGGDVMDKMFKSARYYYRKKSTETKEPVARRKYMGVQKSVLDAIDEHIKSTDYKPSTGFDAFCDLNRKLVEDEIIKLNADEDNLETLDDVRKKIKKTYKNRYFLIVGKKNGDGI